MLIKSTTLRRYRGLLVGMGSWRGYLPPEKLALLLHRLSYKCLLIYVAHIIYTYCTYIAELRTCGTYCCQHNNLTLVLIKNNELKLLTESTININKKAYNTFSNFIHDLHLQEFWFKTETLGLLYFNIVFLQ